MATVEAPERSLLQRREALAKANDVRMKRARLKEQIRAGRVATSDLIAEPPEFVVTAKVFDLMLATPKYGRVKVNKTLRRCGISPSKTVGGLTERQRDDLLRAIT